MKYFRACVGSFLVNIKVAAFTVSEKSIDSWYQMHVFLDKGRITHILDKIFICCQPAVTQSAYNFGFLSVPQPNAIQMAFRWWADCGPLLNVCMGGPNTVVKSCDKSHLSKFCMNNLKKKMLKLTEHNRLRFKHKNVSR